MSYKKEVTIEDFIDLYGNKLPQRVEVVTGMYHGNEEDDDVTVDDDRRRLRHALCSRAQDGEALRVVERDVPAAVKFTL